MEKILLLLSVLLLFAGCVYTPLIPPISYPIPIGDGHSWPNLQEEKSAADGDLFFQIVVKKSHIEDGIITDGLRVDLTVVELNDQKIGLEYAEYSSNPYINKIWQEKQGFNQRFDYVIADKIIRFKGYEFEIVSVKKGQLKYKRIK